MTGGVDAEVSSPPVNTPTEPAAPVGETDPPRIGPPRRPRSRTTAAWESTAADVAIYGVATLAVLVTVRATDLLAHRRWAHLVALPSVAGFLLAVVAFGATRGRRLDGAADPDARARATTVRWVVLAGFVAATVVAPLLVNATDRTGGGPHNVMSEVAVVEAGGYRLASNGTPYPPVPTAANNGTDPLAYFPYQPAMAVFGLPRAWFGEVWWSDARIWFALLTAALTAAALAVVRGAGVPDEIGSIRVVQAIAVIPPAGLTLVTGGDDLPVVALGLLALALAHRRRWAGAGFTMGVALACKLIAVPLAVAIGAFAWWAAPREAPATGDHIRGLRRSTLTRYAAPALVVPVAACLPAVALSWGSFVENVVRYPLGLARHPSTATSPMLGQLLVRHVPGGRVMALVLLGAAAVGIVARMVTHPPESAAGAALLAAAGLCAAIVLAPTTRFGYLVHPIALVTWAVATGWCALDRRHADEGVEHLSSVELAAPDVEAHPTGVP